MRRFLLRFVSGISIVGAMACTDDRPSSSSSSSSSSSAPGAYARVAGEPLMVQGLRPGVDGLWRPRLTVACAHPRCLHVRPDVVAVVTANDAVWVWQTGQAEGAVLPPVPAVDDNEPTVWARGVLVGGGRGPAATSSPLNPPAPTLPSTERTCGTTRAGGGFGYHVIRNDGSVWQRVAWVRPPTDAAVLALPTTAYPIVADDGSLCAWGEQQLLGDRRWTVHHLHSSTTVAAIADREHVPASCQADGAVDVDVDPVNHGGVVRINRDGSLGAGSRPVFQPVPSASVTGKSTVSLSSGALVVTLLGGEQTTLLFPADHSLDGQKVPAGMVRDRVVTVGDGGSLLAVAERFVGEAGHGQELLHMVRVDARGPHVETTPVRDDVVISRLAHGLGAFWWVEGPAVAMRLED